jgi:hypothetical protein
MDASKERRVRLFRQLHRSVGRIELKPENAPIYLVAFHVN